MNKLKSIRHQLISYGMPAVIVLGLAGCGTPKPALQLATDTGARVSHVAGRLAEFVEARAVLSELRAENMASIIEEYGRVEYAQAVKVETLELSGQDDDLGLYRQFVASSESLARMRGSATLAADKHRNLVRASQMELQAPLKELNAVSQALAALGQEMGFKSWIEHYAAYAQEVSDVVKAKQNTIEEARKAAEAKHQELQQPAPATD